MEYNEYLIYISYMITMVAYLLRDILWLRSLAIISEIIMINYGIFKPSFPISLFNSIFLCINTYHVIRLFLERKPIVLSSDLEEIYQKVFHTMSKREFLLFWDIGREQTTVDQKLCTQGDVQKELLLITDGKVDVIHQGNHVASLGKGKFVAEMSFLTGEPASADVSATGTVKYLSWSQEKLKSLHQLNPSLYIKLQVILGQDLSRKLKATTLG
ncbi:MAG: popeye domain-containing protein [Leptospira sp.]|nr:popeye domain-containing protein [Leptospira sp.]